MSLRCNERDRVYNSGSRVLTNRGDFWNCAHFSWWHDRSAVLVPCRNWWIHDKRTNAFAFRGGQRFRLGADGSDYIRWKVKNPGVCFFLFYEFNSYRCSEPLKRFGFRHVPSSLTAGFLHPLAVWSWRICRSYRELLLGYQRNEMRSSTSQLLCNAIC